MSDEVPEDVQRWTARRRAALGLSVAKGETSVAEAARKHGLKVAEVEEWRDRFLVAAESALRSRPRDEDALKDEEIKRLKQKVGDLVLDLDILKTANPAPYGPDDVRRVKSEHMDVSERRVCGVLSVPRSAVREREGGQRSRVAHIDEVLAARVERLIETHPTYGYRRLWALLRFSEGLPKHAETVPISRHVAIVSKSQKRPRSWETAGQKVGIRQRSIRRSLRARFAV